MAGSLRVAREQGATFVELFFDLVFVYAVTQLTSLVLADLTWTGVGRAGLLFWLVWYSWTQFTWTLNLADTEHTLVRLPTLLATALAFFLAQSVPDAFGDAGAWFATTYVLVRIVGLAVQFRVIGREGTQTRSFRAFGTLSLVGLALVGVGGFLPTTWRTVLWIGAFGADMGTVMLAGRNVWELAAGHFTERHGLIVIIALGESLIAAGVATASLPRDTLFALTTAGAVVAAGALWWTYFGRFHARLEEWLDRRGPDETGSFARDAFSLLHAPIVASVILVAVAFEGAVAHPADALELPAALALGAGAAVFLAGPALVARRARAGSRPARLGAALVVLALTPAWSALPPAASLWVVAVLASVVAVVEQREPGPAPR